MAIESHRHGSVARSAMRRRRLRSVRVNAGLTVGAVLVPGILLPFQQQTESAAILKIKESMQEEAKRFEKDTPSDGGPTDYFMQ